MATTRTCEARVWAFGIDRPCGQRVGLRVWYDITGELHQACRAHVAERVHRFPESDPPEPQWLEPDPIDEYKAEQDRGGIVLIVRMPESAFDELEKRAMWGDR